MAVQNASADIIQLLSKYKENTNIKNDQISFSLETPIKLATTAEINKFSELF